ncbi:MAG: 4Fe-4S dicluster domain-containing protein [Candidatus Zixiibacteriota bacterium]|jgi:formate dehydrogenase subunit beta
MKGITYASADPGSAARDLLARGLEAGLWDAVLVPAKVPAGDSYAWLLLRDAGVLENTTPLPPVMSVSGARALYKLARHGTSGKVAAVLRPCEVRAAVELYKRDQLPLDDIVLISMDCPGAVPLKDYVVNPESGEDSFKKLLPGEEEPARSICRTCDHFSHTAADLHVGTLGVPEGSVVIVPATAAGEAAAEALSLGEAGPVEEWEAEVKKRTAKRRAAKEEAHVKLRGEAGGAEGLAATLVSCIGCHACRSVCPICFCRQCYFDSDAMKVPAANTLARAQRKGAARLPTDTFLFHLGRMAHMSLSCVSCGACEDACPAHVPVAELFGLVAANTQATFDYEAGRDRAEAVPTTYYQVDELNAVMAPYAEARKTEGVKTSG